MSAARRASSALSAFLMASWQWGNKKTKCRKRLRKQWRKQQKTESTKQTAVIRNS